MKIIKLSGVIIITSFLLSSCATIVGGGKYWAKVQVPDYPTAKIEANGTYKGTGEANFTVKRRDADELSITIKKNG